MSMHLRIPHKLRKMAAAIVAAAILAWPIAAAGADALERFAPDEIPLGVTLPLTGKFESYGQSALTGVLARVRELNEAGGVGGKRIRPVVRDNRSDFAVTASDIDLFTRDPENRVSAVVGPLLSEGVAAVSRLARERNVVILSPFASYNPDPADAGPVWTFRLGMKAATQAGAMARFQIESYGAATAGLLVDARYPASREFGRLFRDAFEADGGRITAVAVMDSGAPAPLPPLAGKGGSDDGWPAPVSLETCLDILEKAGPDLVYVPCYANQVLEVVHAAGRRPGMRLIRLCGPDFWDNQLVFDGSGSRLLTSCFTSGLYDDQLDYPPFMDFLAAIRESGVEIPDAQSVCGYDAVTLLADAFEKAGTDPRAVRDALLAVRRFPLAIGRTSFDAGGSAVRPVMLRIVGVKDGWPNPEYAQSPDEFMRPKHPPALKSGGEDGRFGGREPGAKPEAGE